MFVYKRALSSIFHGAILGMGLTGCASFQVKNPPNYDKDTPTSGQSHPIATIYADDIKKCGHSHAEIQRAHIKCPYYMA